MKRAIFTLADEQFLTLLERTHLEFEREKIPYILVGGAAVQAHILNYICQKEGVTIRELVESPSFRVQDHLRGTDDIDITLDTRVLGSDTDTAQKILGCLNAIVGENGSYISPSENHLVNVKLERTGLKRPIFGICLDRDELNDDDKVSFNLYHGPKDTNRRWASDMREFEEKFYFDFMSRASTINLNYCKQGRSITLRVKSPEDLLATKIARSREKDWSDSLSLFRHSREAGNPINLHMVEALLYSPDAQGNPNLDLTRKYDNFENVCLNVTKD